jgi:hypothetical protein
LNRLRVRKLRSKTVPLQSFIALIGERRRPWVSGFKKAGFVGWRS